MKYAILAFVLATVLTAGCIGQVTTPQGQPPASGQQAESGSATRLFDVSIRSGAFVPQNITVRVGDTIRWTNDDSAPHLVYYETGGPVGFGGFGSPTLAPGASWSWTPELAGTFAYFCSIHPNVKGTITVIE